MGGILRSKIPEHLNSRTADQQISGVVQLRSAVQLLGCSRFSLLFHIRPAVFQQDFLFPAIFLAGDLCAS